MIQNPILIVLILFAVVTTARWWHERFRETWIMRFLPTPVLCYIPPTLLTTLGILPFKSQVYDWISAYVLPACLVLILMTTDIEGLKRIGRLAFTAILGSTILVLVSGTAVFFLFHQTLGQETWKAAATLSASWIGGTANELAVKQATGFSDQLFTPLFIADITVVYIWMTLLMILSAKQHAIDRFLRADIGQWLNLMRHDKKERVKKPKSKLTLKSILILLALGFGVGNFAGWMGNQIPEIGMAVTKTTWVIVIVTTAGLLLSFTQYARGESERAIQLGYFFFYFVLASTGAKAHLLAILKAPFFMLFCLTWAFIYAVLMIVFARGFRIPMALVATASQANLGGVVSAPIVASTYDPKLTPVAVIFAIFGYAVANYLGILFAQFLSAFG